MTKKQLAIISGIIIPLLGIGASLFFSGKKQVVNVNQSPNSINIAGDNNTVSKLDLPKPKIELKTSEINTPNPNPEIGFDSVYLLEIISDYTIASLPIKIRLPSSITIDMWMYQDIQGVRVGDYSPIEERNGFTFFNIPNAQGEYRLVFGNKKPENLTINDITW